MEDKIIREILLKMRNRYPGQTVRVQVEEISWSQMSGSAWDISATFKDGFARNVIAVNVAHDGRLIDGLIKLNDKLGGS